MIATNALAAFAQDISATQAARPVRGTAPLQAGTAPGATTAGSAGQRILEAVPPQPARPLPRGSLLDLRV